MEISKNLEFLDVIWFNLCGIVMVRDKYDGLKFYIKNIRGESYEEDLEEIINWGSPFPYEAGCKLFGVEEQKEK